MTEPDDLSPKRDAFVREYLVDLNATQAAIRAGYSAATAKQQGYRLLTDAYVQDAIAAAMEKRSKRTEITQDMVLEHWFKIATADANDLMSYRRVNCRHCWGEGFERQEDEDGFQANRVPHPDCPQCRGEGHGYAHFEDTRTVKGPAALLFAGVKQTKDGIEFKTRDQDKAMENVARHLGMFTDKHELKHIHQYSDMSDDELDRELDGLLMKRPN